MEDYQTALLLVVLIVLIWLMFATVDVITPNPVRTMIVEVTKNLDADKMSKQRRDDLLFFRSRVRVGAPHRLLSETSDPNSGSFYFTYAVPVGTQVDADALDPRVNTIKCVVLTTGKREFKAVKLYSKNDDQGGSFIVH